MNYQVHIVQDRPADETIGDLAKLARAVLTHQNAPAGSLSLVLTSEENIRDLNRRFAQVDRPTDVLAFVDGSPDPETGHIYFGDVIIALPIARRQAKRANHSLAAELALLTVHGVLHLIGHDHDQPQGKSKMWRIQEELLRQFGYPFKPLENSE